MDSGFLRVCGPLAFEHGDALGASAMVDQSAFIGREHVAPEFLMVEALNQFAVRLAREILPASDARSRLVLPARVLALTLHSVPPHGAYPVTGRATRRGNIVIVRVRAGSSDDSHAPAADADLWASVVPAGPGDVAGRPEGSTQAAERTWDPRSDPLFRVTDVESEPLSTSFEVRAGCALLAEHFPRFPVAPGSLVLNLVRERIGRCAPGHAELVRLSDVRFASPVVPGASYTLRLRSPSQPGPVTAWDFQVTGGDGRVHTLGELWFATRVPGAVSPPTPDLVCLRSDRVMGPGGSDATSHPDTA